MLENIYIVTDLGPGDGGKGGIVHFLSKKIGASVIIKRGGAQGSHGVRTSFGESFNFSQWGCGTLEGIPTYCSEQMIISPVGLENESDALKRLGIYEPYTLLSVDPNCICATPLHRISSQLEELVLGNNPRGTVGTGVGRACRMSDEFGDDFTIRASELTDRKLVQGKLKKQVDHYRDRYAKISPKDYALEDFMLVSKNLGLLHDEGFLPYIVDLFETVGKKAQLKELPDILSLDGMAIVECSHGVLTDAETGLKPHVSAIRTLPKFTYEMLRDSGYTGKFINLAVHRAYGVRHGAGPMPTYDPVFTSKMLPGSHKDKNRWQGIVRAGSLDLNLIRHAIGVADETPFDGICLTWFDQILKTGRVWSICDGYQNYQLPNESYTEFLQHAKPIISEYRIKNPILKADLFDFVGEMLNDRLGVPLSILSTGSTEVDKIFSKII